MPELTEKEMMLALGQARILGCTKYTSTNDNIYFFDDKRHLRLRIRPGQPMWIGNVDFPADGIWQQGKVSNLRKRYESKPSNSDN